MHTCMPVERCLPEGDLLDLEERHLAPPGPGSKSILTASLGLNIKRTKSALKRQIIPNVLIEQKEVKSRV